jgi:hypothetical protein
MPTDRLLCLAADAGATEGAVERRFVAPLINPHSAIFPVPGGFHAEHG